MAAVDADDVGGGEPHLVGDAARPARGARRGRARRRAGQCGPVSRPARVPASVPSSSTSCSHRPGSGTVVNLPCASMSTALAQGRPRLARPVVEGRVSEGEAGHAGDGSTQRKRPGLSEVTERGRRRLGGHPVRATCGRAARSRAPMGWGPGVRTRGGRRRAPGSCARGGLGQRRGGRGRCPGASSSRARRSRSVSVLRPLWAGEPCTPRGASCPSGSHDRLAEVVGEGDAGPLGHQLAEHLEGGVAVDAASTGLRRWALGRRSADRTRGRAAGARCCPAARRARRGRPAPPGRRRAPRRR